MQLVNFMKAYQVSNAYQWSNFNFLIEFPKPKLSKSFLKNHIKSEKINKKSTFGGKNLKENINMTFYSKGESLYMFAFHFVSGTFYHWPLLISPFSNTTSFITRVKKKSNRSQTKKCNLKRIITTSPASYIFHMSIPQVFKNNRDIFRLLILG